MVDKKLIVELKSAEQVLKIHEGQILTSMRLAKVNIGLLMNFNVPILKKALNVFSYLDPNFASSW